MAGKSINEEKRPEFCFLVGERREGTAVGWEEGGSS